MNPQLTIETPPAVAETLAQAERLGLYPPVAARIQQVAADPAATLDDLEHVVASDAPLGARVLRVANSPLYGLTRRVGTLRQALQVLGVDATRDVALALAILSLGRSSHPERASLRLHALETAAAARRLMLTQSESAAPEAFVAGLLHDLGSLILLEIHGPSYGGLLEQCPDHHTDLLVAEQGRFGYHHATLGAACLQRWNLPQRTCLAVRHHHLPEALTTPEVAQARHLASVVHVADKLVRERHRQADPAASSEEVLAAEAIHCAQLALDASALEKVAAGIDEDLVALDA